MKRSIKHRILHSCKVKSIPKFEIKKVVGQKKKKLLYTEEEMRREFDILNRGVGRY